MQNTQLTNKQNQYNKNTTHTLICSATFLECCKPRWAIQKQVIYKMSYATKSTKLFPQAKRKKYFVSGNTPGLPNKLRV